MGSIRDLHLQNVFTTATHVVLLAYKRFLKISLLLLCYPAKAGLTISLNKNTLPDIR